MLHPLHHSQSQVVSECRETAVAKMGSHETSTLCTIALRLSITKIDGQLISSYQEALQGDADLQCFENTLKTHIKAVINTFRNGGPSTGFFKQVTKYLRYLSEQSVHALLRCRGIGTKKLNRASEERFKLLVDEYTNNSSQMLDFCSELHRFLKAARNTHSYIEYVTQECFAMETAMGTRHYVRISKRLKSLSASGDVYGNYSSAERLLEKVECLRKQQEQMLEKLRVQNEKLEKKESSAHTWRKVTIILFAVAVAGLLISMIVTAALAVPAVAPVLGAAFVPMLASADWITNLFGTFEIACKDQQGENVFMQAGTRVSIKELGDIKFLIDRVVNEIDSLLFAPSSTIKEQIDFTMKDIKLKLETFVGEIETLQEEANKCSSEILKARDKVVKSIKILNNK